MFALTETSQRIERKLLVGIKASDAVIDVILTTNKTHRVSTEGNANVIHIPQFRGLSCKAMAAGSAA